MTNLVPQESHNMQFNIAEAKARFSELVQKALLGEEVIIAKDHKPLLKLVPLEPSPRERKPGLGKGQLLYMAPDFDETPVGLRITADGSIARHPHPVLVGGRCAATLGHGQESDRGSRRLCLC
jgi:antitoxin (DNA-binding transcriptional repressor) of toxin-antitoxin stability system